MRGKRVLSFIMALVMALSLCGNVWAEGLTTEETAAVDEWIGTYIDYNADEEELRGLKGIQLDEKGYFKSEADYNTVKIVWDTYNVFSDDQKAYAGRKLSVTGDYTIEVMMDECRCLTQLPYYGLLKGVTDQAVIDYVNEYICWRVWCDDVGTDKGYSTGIDSAWSWDGTIGEDVYQPTVVKTALDAYKALNATSKAVLDKLTVWDGNVNENYEKSFAAWMQLREQEYRSETNVVTRDLLDINGLTNPDAKKFINDYFETDGKTYYDDGTKCLDIWGKDMVWAPDGGHMTQASYDRAVALMAAYNALSDDAKNDLDRLCVSAYVSFGMRLVNDYGAPYMAAATGTASADKLGSGAKQFLIDAGMRIGADGALTVDGATLVEKDKKWYAEIDFAQTNTADGLASMKALAEALTAYYGRDFDNSLKEDDPFFEPLWDRDRDTYNELNNLKITVNGTAMWFQHAMSWLKAVYNNTLYGGEYEEYFFHAAGYVAPVLGEDFVVRVPDGLEKDVDYTYEYVTDSKDLAENGVLTIHVKAGEKDHWLEAVQNSDKVSLNSGVLFGIDFNRPDSAKRYVSNCGQGIDGVFADYLDLGDDAKQSLYDTGYDMDQNEKWVGNGRMMASINQVGDTLTVTSSDAYGVDHMLMVWYKNAKNSSGGADDLTEVGRRFMIGIRVVVDDPFSYEFNVSTRAATVASVTLDNGWEQIDPEGKDLIVRPESGKTIAELKPQNYQGGDWSLGTFTLTPPETGYTLDVQESDALTQDGRLWEDNDPNTDNTLYLYTHENRTSAVFYTFVWTKDDAPDIKEELTVRVTEAQSVFAGIGKDGIKAEPEESDVVNGQATSASIDNMSTKYDATLGFMETTFNGLPSIEDVQKLRNGEGVTMQPPADATHFRVQGGDGNQDWARIDESFANELTTGLANATTYALYEGNDKQLTRNAKNSLTLAYAAVDVLKVEGLTIYFTTTQNYRYKVVEWLKEDNEGSYTTVGYTYIYGKNGPMVRTETTKSVKDISDVENEDKAYFVCDADVNFTCNQYVQEGAANCWYFRLTVDNEGVIKTDGGYVYLPYSFFGDLTYEKAQQRADPPTILHYAKGDGTDPETITGEYTEYGVRFKTYSFSPFVVKLDDTLKTDDGNSGGSDAVDSGSSTGGHEHVRRYPATVSTGSGTTDGTGATGTGNTVQSAATGDAGIVLYAALCVSSLLGMGYAGKKRH